MDIETIQGQKHRDHNYLRVATDMIQGSQLPWSGHVGGAGPKLTQGSQLFWSVHRCDWATVVTELN